MRGIKLGHAEETDNPNPCEHYTPEHVLRQIVPIYMEKVIGEPEEERDGKRRERD